MLRYSWHVKHFHTIVSISLHIPGQNNTSLTSTLLTFSGRNQICSVNSRISSVKQLKCWVSRGPNLGPILFLLYINDLPNCLELTKANLFADDTNFSCNGFSPYEIEIELNNDIENVHRWLTANKLSLNIKKTEFMIIGSRHRLTTIGNNPVLTLGGKQR